MPRPAVIGWHTQSLSGPAPANVRGLRESQYPSVRVFAFTPKRPWTPQNLHIQRVHVLTQPSDQKPQFPSSQCLDFLADSCQAERRGSAARLSGPALGAGRDAPVASAFSRALRARISGATSRSASFAGARSASANQPFFCDGQKAISKSALPFHRSRQKQWHSSAALLCRISINQGQQRQCPSSTRPRPQWPWR